MTPRQILLPRPKAMTLPESFCLCTKEPPTSPPYSLRLSITTPPQPKTTHHRTAPPHLYAVRALARHPFALSGVLSVHALCGPIADSTAKSPEEQMIIRSASRLTPRRRGDGLGSPRIGARPGKHGCKWMDEVSSQALTKALRLVGVASIS